MTTWTNLMKKPPAYASLPPVKHRAVRGGCNLRSEQGIARDLARSALIPIENKRNFRDVSADVVEHVDPIFCGDSKAAMKVLGGADDDRDEASVFAHLQPARGVE